MPDDRWSISDGYHDVGGDWHETPPATRSLLQAAMGDPVDGPPLWFVPHGAEEVLISECRLVLEDGVDLGAVSSLPGDLPIGYHDLVPLDGGPVTRLIVHPARCPEIPDAWGVAAQIYALWSDTSWGIGDLADLRRIAESLHTAGGRTILVSPLHQPPPSAPQSDSPYYPSSRRAWNPLLLAMDGPVPEELACGADTLIERDVVWPAKRTVLEQRFSDAVDGGDRMTAPDSIAMWNALCDEHGEDWTSWPAPWNRYDRDALEGRMHDDPAFAHRATFHQWCQDQIGDQLQRLSSTGVDIIGDLAVGFSAGGADAWEFQDLLALDMRIGAPPDTFSTDGQEWGIPPFVPWRLRNAWYEPFIQTIRAALRGMQGLRIDHAMGLFRQFWVPTGGKPVDGAYVEFPSEHLLAILAIEATRAGAFVVGEDLGTVEKGVREALAEHAIAGTRVLWFEDEPPSEWPAACLATVTTHDLPTVAGVLTGADTDDEKQERLAAITSSSEPLEAIADVHAQLLAAPSRLRLLSLDDLCAATERPNRPGTVDQPNWRRRLPLPVDRIPLPQELPEHDDSAPPTPPGSRGLPDAQSSPVSR